MHFLMMAIEPLEFIRLMTGLDAPASILISLLLILPGMPGITKGGDLFPDSAVEIARLLRIPPVIIGATIVSMSTTFPELMVSVTSTISGKGGLAVGTSLSEFTSSAFLVVRGNGALGTGNLIGANVLSITLVIATCALIHLLPIQRQTVPDWWLVESLQ